MIGDVYVWGGGGLVGYDVLMRGPCPPTPRGLYPVAVTGGWKTGLRGAGGGGFGACKTVGGPVGSGRSGLHCCCSPSSPSQGRHDPFRRGLSNSPPPPPQGRAVCHADGTAQS